MMKKIIFLVFPLVVFLFTNNAIASGKSLSGKILLQVESSGEAWYVNPADERRYFMGKPEDAFRVMRELGVGISNSNIEKIEVGLASGSGIDSDSDGLSDTLEVALGLDEGTADTDSDGFSDRDELLGGFNPRGSGKQKLDNSFAKGQSGKILLQVERNGEAWYVNPGDNKRYFLGLPNDAYKVMEKFGLGITNKDLAEIYTSDELITDQDIAPASVIDADIDNDTELEVVKQKILEYVNAVMMTAGQNATIEYVADDYGLYKFIIDTGSGQKIETYSTRDGALLFPQAINIDESLEKISKQVKPKANVDISQVEKSDLPKVELFVMSHCPYGTQMEKAILPVAKLLGDKIDFKLKFVNYAMHGEKEVTEQLIEYCIQTDQNDKYLAYLGCFLQTGDNSESCLAASNVDTVLLNECVATTDSAYGITSDLADESTWKNGRFPVFAIYEQECLDYDVSGSPTLVINGKKISVTRTSNALLEAICTSFSEQPAECAVDISDDSPAPGFGYDNTGSSVTDATCG